MSVLPDFLLPRAYPVFKQTDNGLVKTHALPICLFANSFGDIGREASQRDSFHKLLLCSNIAARCIITRAILDAIHDHGREKAVDEALERIKTISF